MSTNEDEPGAAAGSNQGTRAADWTPPNAWADEIDGFSSSIDHLWYKIREKKDELAGGQATQKELDKQFHEEWAGCVTAGYRSLHRAGIKRSSIDFTVYLGLKKMYFNTYGIGSATWIEENKFSAPRKSTWPFDDGYTEWLRINNETASTLPADPPATKVTNPSPAPPLPPTVKLSASAANPKKRAAATLPADPPATKVARSAPALAPTAKPFVPVTNPKEQKDSMQQKQSTVPAKAPIVTTPLSSTYGVNAAAVSAPSLPPAAKKPQSPTEKYIDSTRGHLSSIFRELGLSREMLAPSAQPFEVLVPENAKPQLWFRNGHIMKSAHLCINKDLRITWIDRDGNTFLMPYLSEHADQRKFNSWHEYVILWIDLQSFCSHMATAMSPCPLDKFLTDQKWVNARCLANQAMQAHEQRKVEPTTEASTESLPPPESPRTRQIRLLKEELAEIIDRSVFMVIRETVEKIYARTKRLDDILEDGPHTTRKYRSGALISQKHILDRIRKLWEDHAAYEPEPAKVKQDALTWWWKHKASLKETGQKTGNEGGIMDSYWAGPVEE